MTKILMVCLGNICRSPLAEGILKTMVDTEKVLVDSAGTAGYHIGNPPDPRSISVAAQHNIDISSQRCRKFNRSDFETFDIIFAMDRSNYQDIIGKAKDEAQKSKVKLLLAGSNLNVDEVPDPYYGKENGFENVFQMITAACNVIAHKIN